MGEKYLHLYRAGGVYVSDNSLIIIGNSCMRLAVRNNAQRTIFLLIPCICI